MDVESHVACMVVDDGIGMGGSIVKEVCKCRGADGLAGLQGVGGEGPVTRCGWR